jgi:hypothetical protein
MFSLSHAATRRRLSQPSLQDILDRPGRLPVFDCGDLGRLIRFSSSITHSRRATLANVFAPHSRRCACRVIRQCSICWTL